MRLACCTEGVLGAALRDVTPEAGLAAVASIGHAHIGVLDQEVAGAGLHWDGQVPDGRAVGGLVVGNLLAILVHPEHLQEAAQAVSGEKGRATQSSNGESFDT